MSCYNKYIERERENMYIKKGKRNYSVEEHIDSLDLMLVSSITIKQNASWQEETIEKVPVDCKLSFQNQKITKKKIKEKLGKIAQAIVIREKSYIEKTNKNGKERIGVAVILVI